MPDEEDEARGVADRGTDDRGTWVDHVQTGLDLAGLVPVLGAPADGANAVISAVRGDWVGAALSAAGMVPGLGEAATAGKLAKKAVRHLGGDAAQRTLSRASRDEVADAALRLDVEDEFAQAQGLASRADLEHDVLDQPGIREARRPGAAVPLRFEVGNFAHRYAEQLIPGLKRNLSREHVVPGTARRMDRVDVEARVIYEIKPDTAAWRAEGQRQLDEYVQLMNQVAREPGQRPWRGKLLVYDRDAVELALGDRPAEEVEAAVRALFEAAVPP